MACEGACNRRNNGHRGEVRRVRVDGRYWFSYCEQAVEEDRGNGFIVETEEDVEAGDAEAEG